MEHTAEAEQLIQNCLNKLEASGNWQFYGFQEDYEEKEDNCYMVAITFADRDYDRKWIVWFCVNKDNQVLFDVCEGSWKKFNEADFWQQFAYRVLRGHKGSYCD